MAPARAPPDATPWVRRTTAAAFAFLLPFLAAAPGVGQAHVHPQPDWASDLGAGAVNALGGGVVAAIGAVVRGDDVSRAFVRGAIGGAAVFGGKRVAVGPFDGAGLLGRELAAVGSSLVANAAEGRDWLEEVWLPAGPVRVQVSPGARRGVRIDVVDVGAIVWAVYRPELAFDGRRSLSNGSVVFIAREHLIRTPSGYVDGFTMGGVVVLAGSTFDLGQVQRHENVHVIQQDFLLQALSQPTERWASRRFVGHDVPLDLGLVATAVHYAFLRRIAEVEAQVLEHR